MQTGENEQGLRKIVDMTRLISIAVLLLHFYYYCYGVFEQWDLRSALTDSLLRNIERTGLFTAPVKSKIVALCFLAISLLGARGKKQQSLRVRKAVTYMAIGGIIYFCGSLILWLALPLKTAATAYIGFTSLGFILMLSGGTLLTRIIHQKLNGKDIFNREAETFPRRSGCCKTSTPSICRPGII